MFVRLSRGVGRIFYRVTFPFHSSSLPFTLLPCLEEALLIQLGICGNVVNSTLAGSGSEPRTRKRIARKRDWWLQKSPYTLATPLCLFTV